MYMVRKKLLKYCRQDSGRETYKEEKRGRMWDERDERTAIKR